MTVPHQFLANVIVAATVALLLAIVWSILTARRSAGRLDHRFAIDRLVLAVVGLVAVNGAAGLIVVGSGSRPADLLHLLYGPAALVSLPVGAWLGRRGRPLPSGARSGDRWLLVATVALLGIELRLFMTG